jgi:hypothetical protein
LREHATIQGVIHSITHGQANLRSVATSLHSRIDVEWNSQIDAGSTLEPASGDWGEVSQTVPISR